MAQTALVAGWDFQTTTNGGTAAVVATSAPVNAKSVYLAGFGPQAGTAAIYLDGTNGSSAWVTTLTSNETNGVTGSGNTVNVGTTGFSPTSTSPAALGFVAAGPSAGPYAANGKAIVFALSMTNFKTLSITYANYRSGTGFASQLWEYATSPTGPWLPVTGTVATSTITTTSTPALPAASSFGLVTVPTFSGLDNVTTAYFRITFSGATGNAGTTRLDNIQFNATPTLYYSKPSGDLSLAASYASNSDGTGVSPNDLNGSGVGATYQLAGRGTNGYLLTSDVSIGTALYIQGGITLDLGGKTLTVGTLNTTGTLTGSNTSSLVINTAAPTLLFASGKEQLLNFTLGSGATVTLASALNITSSASGVGVVTLGAGSTLNTGGYLVLNSTLSGTAQIAALGAGAAINGNATAERYLSDKRAWRLITPSVYSTQSINNSWQEGAASSGQADPHPGYGTYMIGGSTANGYDYAGISGSLLAYNGTAFNSVPNTITKVLSTEPGYFLFSTGSRSINPSTDHSSTVLRSNGIVVTGTQTANIAASGYTLVGNPYPAPVDFANVTKSGTVADQFYTWDATIGTYGAYVLIYKSGATYATTNNSSTLNNIVPAGAAIFANTNGTAGTLTINESSKATGTLTGPFNNFSTSIAAATHDLRVNLTDAGSNTVDAAIASFAPGYSNQVDNSDALKLSNFYENISLARSGKLLVLERRSDIVSKDTIFIQLSGVKAITYKLQINPNDFNAPSGMTAYLEDAFLHTSTKLDLGNISTIAFSTTADSTSYKNRFQITFAAASPTTAAISKISHVGASVVAYPNPAVQKQINLSFDGLPAGSYNITVMNNFGQVMQKSNMAYNGTTTNKLLSADYSTGMYTVNIQSVGYNQSIKVIVP